MTQQVLGLPVMYNGVVIETAMQATYVWCRLDEQVKVLAAKLRRMNDQDRRYFPLRGRINQIIAQRTHMMELRDALAKQR